MDASNAGKKRDHKASEPKRDADPQSAKRRQARIAYLIKRHGELESALKGHIRERERRVREGRPLNTSKRQRKLLREFKAIRDELSHLRKGGELKAPQNPVNKKPPSKGKSKPPLKEARKNAGGRKRKKTSSTTYQGSARAGGHVGRQFTSKAKVHKKSGKSGGGSGYYVPGRLSGRRYWGNEEDIRPSGG